MKSMKTFIRGGRLSSEEYLSEDHNANLREIENQLDRGLTFEGNMLSALVRVTVSHGDTTVLVNPLRNKKGIHLEPTGFIVLMDTGSHRDVCRGSVWGAEQVSFKNYHASAQETWDILLIYSPTNFVLEA